MYQQNMSHKKRFDENNLKFFIVYVIVKCQKIDLFAIYKILLQDLPTQGQTTNGQKRDKR